MSGARGAVMPGQMQQHLFQIAIILDGTLPMRDLLPRLQQFFFGSLFQCFANHDLETEYALVVYYSEAPFSSHLVRVFDFECGKESILRHLRDPHLFLGGKAMAAAQEGLWAALRRLSWRGRWKRYAFLLCLDVSLSAPCSFADVSASSSAPHLARPPGGDSEFEAGDETKAWCDFNARGTRRLPPPPPDLTQFCQRVQGPSPPREPPASVSGQLPPPPDWRKPFGMTARRMGPMRVDRMGSSVCHGSPPFAGGWARAAPAIPWNEFHGPRLPLLPQPPFGMSRVTLKDLLERHFVAKEIQLSIVCPMHKSNIVSYIRSYQKHQPTLEPRRRLIREAYEKAELTLKKTRISNPTAAMLKKAADEFEEARKQLRKMERFSASFGGMLAFQFQTCELLPPNRSFILLRNGIRRATFGAVILFQQLPSHPSLSGAHIGAAGSSFGVQRMQRQLWKGGNASVNIPPGALVPSGRRSHVMMSSSGHPSSTGSHQGGGPVSNASAGGGGGVAAPTQVGVVLKQFKLVRGTGSPDDKRSISLGWVRVQTLANTDPAECGRDYWFPDRFEALTVVDQYRHMFSRPLFEYLTNHCRRSSLQWIHEQPTSPEYVQYKTFVLSLLGGVTPSGIRRPPTVQLVQLLARDHLLLLVPFRLINPAVPNSFDLFSLSVQRSLYETTARRFQRARIAQQTQQQQQQQQQLQGASAPPAAGVRGLLVPPPQQTRGGGTGMQWSGSTRPSGGMQLGAAPAPPPPPPDSDWQ